MATKSKVTPIVRGNMKTLRADLTSVIVDIMRKHGLQATMGNITFEPNREFRCKLTVMQTATPVVSGTKPAVGETWMFGGKSYVIVALQGQTVLMTRPVRGFPRQFRGKLEQIVSHGIKVK